MNSIKVREIVKEEICCALKNAEGGCCYEEITLPQALAMIQESAVEPNKLYRITGVHKNRNEVNDIFHQLYDDGTNSGTTIYLRGLTTTKFSPDGYGEFYNPKYDKEDYGTGGGGYIAAGEFSGGSGYTTATGVPTLGGSGTGLEVDIVAVAGVVTSVTISNIGSGYVLGDFITIDDGNQDATFTLFISAYYLYNIWDGERPYTNTNKHAIGDKVIWGGYVWENITGLSGSATDIFNLDSDNWAKINYNITDYNFALDIITYDIAHDWISRRKSGTIDVFFPYDYWISAENSWIVYSGGGFQIIHHAIPATQFGNSFDANYNLGVGLIQLNDAYCETINFKGTVFLGATLTHYSVVSEAYWGKNANVKNLRLDNRSFTQKTVIIETVLNGVSIQNNSWIDSLQSTESNIGDISLTNNSWMQGGELGLKFEHSQFNFANLQNQSYITDFNCNQSQVISLVITNGGYMLGTLSEDSIIENFTIDSGVVTCGLSNGGTVTNLYTNGKDVILTENLPLFVSGIGPHKGSIHTREKRVYSIYLPFNGSAGRGLVGALTIPDYWLSEREYISEVIVSHVNPLTYGANSNITLGIETDDIDSGLTAVTGLVSTLDGVPAIRYDALANTISTSFRKIVAAVNTANITDGALRIIVIVKYAEQ